MEEKKTDDNLSQYVDIGLCKGSCFFLDDMVETTDNQEILRSHILVPPSKQGFEPVSLYDLVVKYLPLFHSLCGCFSVFLYSFLFFPELPFFLEKHERLGGLVVRVSENIYCVYSFSSCVPLCPTKDRYQSFISKARRFPVMIFIMSNVQHVSETLVRVARKSCTRYLPTFLLSVNRERTRS